VRPHPNADRKILANDEGALLIVLLILIVMAVVAMGSRVLLGRRLQNSRKAGSSSDRKLAQSPSPPSSQQRPRSHESEVPTDPSTAESEDMDLAMVADAIGDEIQEGIETVQEGVAAVVDQVTELGGYVGGLVGLQQDSEEILPPDVFIAYRADSVGLTGRDVAEDLEERLRELGYTCYLFGPERDQELDKDTEEEILMNLLASKLYLALVDNEWVEYEMHLRCLAASVLGTETHHRPVPFIVHDHEFQYREELAIKNFKLTQGNSHVLVRAADLGHVFDQIRPTLPATPGGHLQEDEEEEETHHFMQRVWPVEARLRSQMSQKRSIITATEQARGGGPADNSPTARSQLILPTFTRPSIRFDNVDKS